MLVFAVVLILLLWLIQIVYLEKIYKTIKTNEIEHTITEMSQIIESEDEDVLGSLKNTAAENEICLSLVDSEGKVIFSADNSFGCIIHTLSADEYASYYKKTQENGGNIVFTSDEENRKQKIEDKQLPKPKEQHEKPDSVSKSSVSFDGDFQKMPEEPKGDNKDFEEKIIEENLVKVMQGGRESMVCASIVNFLDEDVMLIVDARLTPVDATVNTLRFELAVISAFMLVLALVLAVMISRAVSEPIIKVNNSAKKLAKGEYNVRFDGRGYREISELSDTLNYTSAELAKTERYQQELIANVSHDLRTPLTMITAYSEVMRDLPGENTPENVQVIIEEADRLTNLVNDMLDISKLQQGVLEKKSTVYNFTESIQRVMERYSKLKTQDGYDITFEYDEDVIVEADEFKIFQVLYNLINNAINYTGDDKKVVVKQIVKKDKVRIEVRDTGNGIPKEELSNVWERYYKASGSHKRAVKGTGLGLSIVKNILKLHDASYGVESEVNKGSTFWFELDICQNKENTEK